MFEMILKREIEPGGGMLAEQFDVFFEQRSDAQFLMLVGVKQRSHAGGKAARAASGGHDGLDELLYGGGGGVRMLKKAPVS